VQRDQLSVLPSSRTWFTSLTLMACAST